MEEGKRERERESQDRGIERGWIEKGGKGELT